MATINKIVIDYDARKGQFIIGCPIWANDVVRAIPSRRFMPKDKLWSAPAIRTNVNYMELNLKSASWSQLALEKLAEVKNAVGNAVAPALPFPLHYPFKTQPFRTQRLALEKAFGRTAFAFFKDMGTGKTKTLIDLACASRQHGLIETVIIICPIAVRKNWQREIAIHSPFPVDSYLLNTAKIKDFESWMNRPHDFKWLIVGVESLGIAKSANEAVLGFLLKFKKTMTAIDESHKIKTHNAIRSERCHTIGRHSAYRVIMTGTPIAKGVMDIYSPFEFLDPNIIGCGDFYSFRNRYAVMGGHESREIIGYQNMDELMEIINPFIYQVRKEEALPDLPPKLYTRRYVTLTEEQTKHYRTMAKDKIVISGDLQMVVKNALTKAMRLQQITGGFLALQSTDPLTQQPITITEAIGTRNPKLQDVLEFCEEIGDKSVIIWCAFKPEIDAVVAALRDRYGHDDVVEVHGGRTEAQRDHDVNELFEKRKATKLVANLQTGGTGLTMVAAEAEYFFSNTHNFVDRQQGEDRAHRKGQTKNVLIADVISQINFNSALYDTVDILPVESNEVKKDLAEYVRGRIDELAARGVSDISSIFGID